MGDEPHPPRADKRRDGGGDLGYLHVQLLTLIRFKAHYLPISPDTGGLKLVTTHEVCPLTF